MKTKCSASNKRQRHDVEDIDDILKKTAEDYEAWKQNMTNEVSEMSNAFPLPSPIEIVMGVVYGYHHGKPNQFYSYENTFLTLQ